MSALAEARGVVVSHGMNGTSIRALNGVDFAVEEHESVALWGPSGSGKTTLLHVLGGLVGPTSGSILWRGEAMPTLQESAQGSVRGHRLAYIFQGAKLLPTLTAYENVAFARWASASEHEGRSTTELLGLVGLAKKLDSLPPELSGGEAQRVAIARALAQAPELLLCDEPTGQLDSDTGERVLDLIAALKEEIGFALVVATHDAHVARRYDRTVELADGRVLEERRV